LLAAYAHGAAAVAPTTHIQGGTFLGGVRNNGRISGGSDGIFVGTVDQFKGYFQHLETTAGYHLVEFVAPDYDPLIVEVAVAPNKTTTYRASLNRAAGR